MENVPDQPTRLSKVVAALVPCSRREAEQYIAQGWVRVNGQVVHEPQFRVSDETVRVDPQARLQAVVPATFLVNKPAGAETAAARTLLDPSHRWEEDASRIPMGKRDVLGLTCLLELPALAAGLTVFSEDERIVRKLRDDANFVEQELVAQVEGVIAEDGLQRLCGGLVFQGRSLPPARVSWQSETRLRFAIKGISLDVLPWMCAQVGLQLIALKRIRIGALPMSRLPTGQWRHLGPGERF
jgi:23S rRNA pseudouridine2604 synthase